MVTIRSCDRSIAGGNVHRCRRKSRILARHAILAFTPLAAAYLAGAGRVTLGGSLNLLWLLLTVAAVMHCLEQKVSRAARTQQLLALALVLALFFPIISLDDDHALAEMPPDLQSLVSAPAKQKTAHAPAGVDALPASPVLQVTAWMYVVAEGLAPLDAGSGPLVWREASGNHSPPAA